MIEYNYKAKDRQSGEIVKGKISADSQMSAAELLSSKDLFPIKISTIESESVFTKSLSVSRVSTKSRVIFTRQLATLVGAGLPINQALNTAIDQVSEKSFKSSLLKIAAAVEGGQSLGDSFAKYPRIFNKVFVSLVRAGEQSGTLDDTLQRLADQQEKQQEITSKVRGALIYPLLVLVVIIAVMAYMLITVMPQIEILYKDLNKPLPILTQITLVTSTILVRFWPLTILLTLVVIFAVRAYIKTPTGRSFWDRTKLNLPVFGVLLRKLYMARFTRTLGSLVTSGVPLLEAMHTSAEAINNVAIERVVLQASEQVKGGVALSETLSGSKVILPLVPQMIRVGEESGTLGEMLDKVATFYETEVDQTVKNLSTIIEPILMVILGAMVFFIIIAILFPVYSLVGEGVTANPSTNTSSP